MSGLDMETELLEDEDEDEESERTQKIQKYTKLRDEMNDLYIETREITYDSLAKFYQKCIDIHDCQVTTDEMNDVKVEGLKQEADRSKYSEELGEIQGE